MQAIPKYMGLRLKRYIPEETMFTVRSGANGFTVVRARLNDSTPAASTVRPSTTSARAGTSSSGGLPVSGGIPQMSHISEAHSAPISGGGTLCSRAAASLFMGNSYLFRSRSGVYAVSGGANTASTAASA